MFGQQAEACFNGQEFHYSSRLKSVTRVTTQELQQFSLQEYPEGASLVALFTLTSTRIQSSHFTSSI